MAKNLGPICSSSPYCQQVQVVFCNIFSVFNNSQQTSSFIPLKLRHYQVEFNGLILKKITIIFFLLLYKRQEKHRQRELLIADFTPQMPSVAEAGPGAEAGSKNLNPGFLHEWRGPYCLSHHCCLSGLALVGSWNQELSWDLNLGTLMWDVGSLTARPDRCLPQWISSTCHLWSEVCQRLCCVLHCMESILGRPRTGSVFCPALSALLLSSVLISFKALLHDYN